MNGLFESLSAHPVLGGGLALGLVGYIVAILRNAPLQLYRYGKSRLITSVEIPDKDPAFEWFDRWLASNPASHRKRDYVVRTEQESPTQMAHASAAMAPGPSRGIANWRFSFSPAPGSGIVRYRDHRLWVERRRRWYETAFNGAPYQDTYVITHLGSRNVIRDLLQEALDGATNGKDPGIPVLVGGGGCWGNYGFKPRRPIESIILDGSLLDSIVDDMRDFYAAKDWYQDRGIPWHRGYLFAGVPGSGKTSTSIGIAGHLGLGIALVSLSSSDMDDQALSRLMIGLPEKSLLLVEDVDALFVERDSKCRVTFAGFLNALDGVAASEGRVLVMTTNHPEKLDPALIRCGRVDRRVDFGYATPDQARRLFLWFFRDVDQGGANLGWLASCFARAVGGNVSMAAIQEHLLRYRNSPDDATTSLVLTELAA